MVEHNPRARYCIRILRGDLEYDDEATCPACDELRTAVRLDPDLYDEEGNPRDVTYAEPDDPVRAKAAVEAFDRLT